MYFYVPFVVTILLDWITKILASSFLTQKVPLLWNFIYLEFMQNSGIAFSIPVPYMLLKILTIVLIIALYYYYKSERKTAKNTKLLDISFGMILAWACRNAFERIFHGKVVDFFWVQHFAIFNLADVGITLWAILFIYHSFFQNK